MMTSQSCAHREATFRLAGAISCLLVCLFCDALGGGGGHRVLAPQQRRPTSACLHLSKLIQKFPERRPAGRSPWLWPRPFGQLPVCLISFDLPADWLKKVGCRCPLTNQRAGGGAFGSALIGRKMRTWGKGGGVEMRVGGAGQSNYAA